MNSSPLLLASAVELDPPTGMRVRRSTVLKSLRYWWRHNRWPTSGCRKMADWEWSLTELT